VIVLPVLFFLNLYINHLWSINNFDLEKINLTNPQYLKLIDKYRYDDVGMIYTLRMWFYSAWLNVFLWIDSILKILSPVFWVRTLGFSGAFLACLGLNKINKKWWWWFLAVVVSAGLGILIDTKMAVVLALPVIVLTMLSGLKSKFVHKYWWILIILVAVDLILK